MDIKEARQMYSDGFRADNLTEYAEQNNLTDDQVKEMATWLRKAEFEVHADEVAKQVKLLNDELIAITGDEKAVTTISSYESASIDFKGNFASGKARWIFGENVMTGEEIKQYQEKMKKEAREALIDELMEEIRRKMS